MANTTDVVIIGGGPAGLSAAYMLRKYGIPYLVLEKENFPRQKVCGGALSPDVLNQFKKMGNDLHEWLLSYPHKQLITRSIINLPDGKQHIFSAGTEYDAGLKGFVINRMQWDAAFHEIVSQAGPGRILCGRRVVNISQTNDFVSVTDNHQQDYRAKLLIVANGGHSALRKMVFRSEQLKYNYLPAYQTTASNVKGLEPNDLLLDFQKDWLPGYFWVFPQHDGNYNIGIGATSQAIRYKKLPLKKLFFDGIHRSPLLGDLFSEAEIHQPLSGSTVPYSFQQLPASANRILFAGDAAFLANPLTGEGIGNAIRSGRFAADQAKSALTLNKYSTDYLKLYDQRLQKALKSERRMSSSIYWLLRQKFAFSLGNQLLKMPSVRKRLLSM